MKKQFITIIAASLLTVAVSAFAAVKEGEFSLSPVVGGYTFDSKQHLKTNLVYGGRLGYNFTKHFGVEGLFDYLNTKSTQGEGNFDAYRYGGELLYHFFPDSALVPFVAAGGGGETLKGKEWKRSRPMFDYGAGLKYFITDSVALRGDVRHIIFRYDDRTFNNIEYTLGAYIPFGGVKPAVKAAPVQEAAPQPKAEPAPVAAPAPLAPVDNLNASPSSILKGESSTLTWTSENAASCEIQPGIGPVQTQGSMKVKPDDNTSYTLTCSGAGGTARSSAIVAVSPPAPVAMAAQPKASAAKLCQPTVIDVHFDTNKADIKPRYHDELKKLADFLKENPNATGVIEGHTDSVGSKASNMKLSQRRADSVRSYIIKKFGIAPQRFSAKGYGPTKPIADNKTKAGKEQNRRIEANFSCDGK